MVLGSLLSWGGWKAAKGAYDWYQKEKQNQSGLIGKLAKSVGNHIQENYIDKIDNGLLKMGADALNRTLLNPDSKKSSENNYPDVKNGAVKNESYKSSNASYSGGEGSLYGSKPGARNPYDYASTDFESIMRKQMTPQIATNYNTGGVNKTRAKAKVYHRFHKT